MRRSSVLQSQTSEPLIVVEDEENENSEAEKSPTEYSRQNSEDECMNPYLLSPYTRETRKHSLPTPQCSGITASQVRRLSDQGETAIPGPKQVEFLSTLSSAPQQVTGRRHSVVTISRVVPPTTSLFGRNRRESLVAFPSSNSRVLLPNRRESIACPPSTEPRGSIHNLQLDIMDDIVQARKVRMKMWGNSTEKICEVQPLDNTGNVQYYTNTSRRFSDFVGTTLTPIPSSSNQKTSSEQTVQNKSKVAGIVCSNTDLISILTSLSTSATEINVNEVEKKELDVEQKKRHLKSSRSNSFDVSVLENESEESKHIPSNWFIKRHQPIVKTEKEKSTIKGKKASKEKEPNKVIWDERSGSIVDPQALGSAIEVFLRKSSLY